MPIFRSFNISHSENRPLRLCEKLASPLLSFSQRRKGLFSEKSITCQFQNLALIRVSETGVEVKQKHDSTASAGARRSLRGVEPDLKAQLVNQMENLLVKQAVAPGFAQTLGEILE